MAKDFDNRRAQLRAMQQAEATKKRNRKIVVTVLCVVVAVVLIGGGIAAWRQFQKGVEASLPPNATEKQDGILANPDAPDDAPKLEIYFDYQCPACRNFEEQMGPTITEMIDNNEAQVTYHTMTFLDRNLRNDASARAANAAYCADDAGAYNDFHLSVFKNQPQHEGEGYNDEQLRDTIPQQAGITGDKLTDFQQCYDAKKYDSYVTKVDNEAGKNGVTGTPTIRVDGADIDLKSIGTPEAFRKAVLGS